MSEIILKANFNDCKVENWGANTNEVNARTLKVEMCDELCSCAEQFVTFKLEDGTVYESKVIDGKADIPVIKEAQVVKIGIYATDIKGDKCNKRYSSQPVRVYVDNGSYHDNASDPPIPTPNTYNAFKNEILGALDEVSDMLGGGE